MSCIFCQIAQHEVSANIVHEDDHVIVFNDLFPQAPVHMLIVPKTHYSTLNDIPPEDTTVFSLMHRVAAKLAHDRGFADKGYRLTLNCNRDGGQSVYHVHMHLLAGRPLLWPPG